MYTFISRVNVSENEIPLGPLHATDPSCGDIGTALYSSGLCTLLVILYVFFI